MTKEELQKLRDLPIEGVVQRLGLEVHRHRTTCMFHADKHPSMYIDVKRNVCKCYSCGARAGSIDLVMKVLGKTFCEACQWLAGTKTPSVPLIGGGFPRRDGGFSLRGGSSPLRGDRGGLGLDLVTLSRLITPPRLNPEAQRFLFAERHIHPAVACWLRLSSISRPMPTSAERYCTVFNAPSLLIPYFDIDGKLLSVQARYLGDPPQPSLKGRECFPRFQFPRGAQCHLYNLPVLSILRDGEDLYIAEGPSDCMALLSAGHKAIAVPSATLLTPDVVEILRQYAPHSALHIYPDRDQAGERLFAELAKVANAVGVPLVRHELPEGCKDFSDAFASAVLKNYKNE